MNLAAKYDELIVEITALLDKYDPCSWDCKEKDCARKTKGCCQGCERLSENGCTICSLACKLWICPEIRLHMPEHVLDEFREVWDEAAFYDLLTFRGSKEESVHNAKYRNNRSLPTYVLVTKYGESSWVFDRT